ncbi:MAG TPA: methyltransferase domain-containing protein [Gaiellales bacterium]|jgi:SAM-dependent methyltransferase
MTGDELDRDSWDRRWSQALGAGAHAVDQRPPNAHLLAEVADLSPGLALDAGAGHGAETLWLASRCWRVDAVDFSTTALEYARVRAERLGADVAGRVEWIAADLATWIPPPERYDLVVCLYVHIAGSVPALLRRLAAGVATDGTLLLVGHRPIDPATGAGTPAAGQVQVSVDEALSALDPERWEIVVAEDRPRAVAGSGVDAVVHARRHT